MPQRICAVSLCIAMLVMHSMHAKLEFECNNAIAAPISRVACFECFASIVMQSEPAQTINLSV
jgi:hypothetical protein